MTKQSDHDLTTSDEAESATRSVRGTGWIASKIPLLLVVGVALIFHSRGGDMEVGSFAEPGPEFWPRILIIALIGTSVLGLFVDLTDGIEPFERSGFLRVVAGFGALCLFVLVFQQAGMILAGMVVLVLWLKGLNGESWRMSLSIAVVAPVLTYLLFVQALGVQFPDDLIASLFGGR